MTGSATLLGVAELGASITAAGVALAHLDVAPRKTAELIGNAAAGAAPRRSGRLAASGTAAAAGGRAVVEFGSSAVPYAGPIHWGWPARHIRPQEFASRAAQRTEAQWIEFYAADVQTTIDTIKGV